MSSVPPSRTPQATASPRSTTTSPGLSEMLRPSTIAYPWRPGPITSTDALELLWPLAAMSRPVNSWRRENAARSGQRLDPLCHPGRLLRVEADDHVGEVSGTGRTVKASAETVGDDDGGGQHRRREPDPEPRQQRPPAARTQPEPRRCERGPQADSVRPSARGAGSDASSRPLRSCSTRSAIAAASGSCVTSTTALRRGRVAALVPPRRSPGRGSRSARRRAQARGR